MIRIHLVIGSKGEVGIALTKLLKKQNIILEIDSKSKINNVTELVDFIHICFPWTLKFNHSVKTYHTLYGKTNSIVIIHSTVYPGTTLELSKIINNIVYSPIRGKHPNIYNDLKYWTKYFCSLNQQILNVTLKEFEILGIKTKGFCENPTSLELGKHFSTLMYGYSLLFGQELAILNKSNSFNPKTVLDFVNDTGNVLKDRKIYPYIESIGGHCILPNAKMISEISFLAKELEKANQRFEDIFNDKKIYLEGSK